MDSRFRGNDTITWCQWLKDSSAARSIFHAVSTTQKLAAYSLSSVTLM